MTEEKDEIELAFDQFMIDTKRQYSSVGFNPFEMFKEGWKKCTNMETKKIEITKELIGKRILWYSDLINYMEEGIIVEISPSNLRFKIKYQERSVWYLITKEKYEILPDKKAEVAPQKKAENEISVDKDMHFEYMGSHKMLEALKGVGIYGTEEWKQAMENIKEEGL